MKVNKIVLKVTVFLVFINVGIIKAQNIPYDLIFDLDSLEQVHQVNKFTLNSKELYGFDKTLEVYNDLLYPDEMIMLLTVLPPYSKSSNWVKVLYNDIKDKLATKDDIRDIRASLKVFELPDNSMQNRLLKEVNGSFYLSRTCLTEFYLILPFAPPLHVNIYKTLNPKADTVAGFLNRPPQYRDKISPFEEIGLIRNIGFIKTFYHSKTYRIGQDTAYQFWNFNHWAQFDGWDYKRGADRLVFIPGKGIVGGSYDFWFFPPYQYDTKELRVSEGREWKNIIREKVMIAEELRE